MSATLDLAAVRRITQGLRENAARCDNGEGTECATLEAKIRHYVTLCDELRSHIREWAHSIFEGKAAADAEVETLFREAAATLLAKAGHVVTEGVEFDGPCYYLDGLPQLQRWVGQLDYLVTHWSTPKVAVGPASRAPLNVEAEAEARRVIAGLPALPAGWQPSTLEQREFARKQRSANLRNG